jgi:hypothetical protein
LSAVAKERCGTFYSDEPSDRPVKIVMAFREDKTLTYSRATGCSGAKVLFGRWQRTGTSVTVQINVVDPPSQKLFTAEITSGSKLSFIDGISFLRV